MEKDKMYKMIAQLRSDGDNNYHGLTGIYVNMHSIIIAALTVTAGFVSPEKIIINRPFFWLVIVILVFGIILTFIMHNAQKRYSIKNKFWEKCLCEIEDDKDEQGSNLFANLKKYIKENHYNCFMPYRRMASFPIWFFLFYSAFLGIWVWLVASPK